MKLNEVKQLKEAYYSARLNADGFLTDERDIKDWCHEEAMLDFFSIASDNSVSTGTDVVLNIAEDGMYHCPVQFSTIGGKFKIEIDEWTSLKGCPTHVDGSVDLCKMRKIKSLEFAPKVSTGWYRIPDHIESIVGIENYIKKIDGTLYLETLYIKNGGIGILLIEGVDRIDGTVALLTPPFLIIEKYIGRPDEIFACQTELMDAGYEDYAIL